MMELSGSDSAMESLTGRASLRSHLATMAFWRLTLVRAFICSILVLNTSANEGPTATPSAGTQSVYSPGQGQVSLNNRIGTWLDAPIWQPNGSPPSPETTVQLMLVKSNGTLEPLLPTTRFRNDGPPAARFYFWPIVPSVPGVSSGEAATFRLRVWEGLDWESATLRGESHDMTITVGGGIMTPPNLPLEQFDLFPRVTLTLPAPNSSAAVQTLPTVPERTVTIQTSTDLVNWERFSFASLGAGRVSFETFADNQCRFYRISP